MSHIDERIVKMTFDNSAFEGRIEKTIQSLEKLNNVLKNTGNTEAVSQLSKSMKDIKGQLSTLNLDELNKITEKQSVWQKIGSALSSAGKGIGTIFSKLDIGGTISKIGSSFNKATEGSNALSNSVDKVSSGFSALGIVGATALANITNGAVNAGKRLVKSLTIEPITTGFSEYETKMGSIQTILTNTAHHGTTLEDVNKALNELNEYSDQTIYNFAEMTRNIGTFTAAGVDLPTSTAAIKGIANLAAASGSSSAQASTAMYQLSQALASGKVSLQDWNSVVNAGMGGKLFQDALIRTSEKMGTGADAAIKKYGSFRESLTKGEWLTAEVLTETLKQISGAYTEADLIAQGYTKSQAKQIVELAKNATAAATEVKTVSQLFDTMKESVQSGWAQSWEYIIGDKEQATKLLTGVKDAFDAMIKPSVDARNEMLKFWNEAGGRDDVIKGLGNIFKSLGKGMGAIGDAWKEVFPPMTGEKLVTLSKKFKDFTEKIKMNDKTAAKIKDTFKGVFDVFDMVKDSVVKVASGGFKPMFDILKNIGGVALNAASGIGKFASNLANAVKNSNIFDMIGSGINTSLTWVNTFITGIGKGISTAFDKFGSINLNGFFGGVGKSISAVGNIIKPIVDGISKAISSINFDSIMKTFQTVSFLSILKVIKNVFDEIKDTAGSAKSVFESFKDIGSNISDSLSSVCESLKTYQQNLKADTLMKIAGAIAILAGSLILLSSIKTSDLVVGLAGISVLLGELVLACNMLDIKSKIGLKGAASLISIASAMLILSTALKILSTIDIGEMLTGLVGMAGVIGAMVVAVKTMDGKTKNLKKTAASLVIFGIALMTMAGALKLLGSIDAETMGSGLFAMAVVLTEIAAFLAVAKYGDLSTSAAAGILIISAALVVLSQAVKQLGSLNEGQLKKGLGSIAAILAGVAAFSKLGGSGLNLMALSVGLTGVGAAMMVMSAAMKSLGSSSWETINRGLTSMAGTLTILGVASKLISGVKMTVLSVGIAAMSASLLLLSAALQSLGGMSWEQLGTGLVALAGSLTILALAMAAMSGGLMGAAAMVVMAGALAILTPQLLLLSQLSLQQVGIGLLALAGAFTVIGVAGLLLTPLLPVLIGLGAAIALLGVGCMAAGAGCALFGTGLGLIAAAVGGGGLVIVEFIRQLINLLPQLGTKMGEAIVNMAAAIGEGGSALVTAFTTLISSILTAIGTLIPQIVQVAVDVVVAFCQGLATAIPQVVTAGMELIVGVLEGIAANIGPMVTAGMQVVINFMDGVAAELPNLINSAINLALTFIEGVAEGLNSNQGRLEAAIEQVITAVINAGLAVISGAISGFVSGGEDLMNGLIDGIESLWESVKSATKKALDKAKEGVSGAKDKLVQAGKDLIQGLINGIGEKVTAVKDAVQKAMSSAIEKAKSVLGINSPSKVFIEIGKHTANGLAVGLNKYSNRGEKAAGRLAETVIDSVKNPLSKLGNIIDGGIDVNPVITPVMDLSNVKNGSRMIGDMLTNVSGMGVTANGAGAISRTIGNIQNGNDNSDIVNALKDLQEVVTNSSGNTYNVNGITYDDGSNITNAVQTLVRAAKIERRM